MELSIDHTKYWILLCEVFNVTLLVDNLIHPLLRCVMCNRFLTTFNTNPSFVRSTKASPDHVSLQCPVSNRVNGTIAYLVCPWLNHTLPQQKLPGHFSDTCSKLYLRRDRTTCVQILKHNSDELLNLSMSHFTWQGQGWNLIIALHNICFKKVIDTFTWLTGHNKIFFCSKFVCKLHTNPAMQA